MRISRAFSPGCVVLALVLLTTATPALQAATDSGIQLGATDVGGVVTSAHGPGAGVRVIALTNDLPTKYATIVVADDRGRYLVPDLPQMRVPDRLSFYAKNVDGRIDDPNAGWKGRGLWTTYGSRTPWHVETGKGTRPKVYRFQIRPNPLAD